MELEDQYKDVTSKSNLQKDFHLKELMKQR